MSSLNLRGYLKRYILESGNPDAIAYGRKLVERDSEFARFEWLISHVIDVGRMRGARVLDIGCGFGWQALALSMLADATVVANDIRPTMTDVVTQRMTAVGCGRVSALCADICTADIAANSFDAILCNQTVEHVYDLDRMFRACYRVLKPGGRAVILNDNNALTPGHLAEIQEMWRRRDSSWEYIAELKAKRPIENADAEPYAVMRKRAILHGNPSLDDSAVERLAAATAGMVDAEIESLASRYPNVTMPTPPRLSWCRNPATGEYCERLLDPYEIRGMLEQAGFKVRVRHMFRKFPLSLLNGVQCRPLNNVLFARKPMFMLLAVKPAT